MFSIHVTYSISHVVLTYNQHTELRLITRALATKNIYDTADTVNV